MHLTDEQKEKKETRGARPKFFSAGANSQIENVILKNFDNTRRPYRAGLYQKENTRSGLGKATKTAHRANMELGI